MGMTENQLFRASSFAGGAGDHRRAADATVSTVAIATMAVFAGGGLDGEFTGQIDFKTNVIIASLICVVMAVIFDLLLVLLRALITTVALQAVTERRKGRFFEMFRRTAS